MSKDDWPDGEDSKNVDFVDAINTGTVIDKRDNATTNEKNTEEKTVTEEAPEAVADEAITKAQYGDSDNAANQDKNQGNDDPPKTNSNGEQNHGHSHGEQKNIIIIKRVKKVVGGHHGGAWKIAYADFVTAMMTFFLLMWLLSMLNKYQKQGISEYFQTPMDEAVNQSKNQKADKIVVPGDIVKEKQEIKDKTESEKEKEKEKEKKKEDKKEDAKQNPGKAQSEAMKKDLENFVKNDPILSQYENSINFKVTSNGLKIELKDLENKTMFSKGKANFGEYGKEILDWLGNKLNDYPNRVMIIGHTDSAKYPGPEGYTNWELSSDRANATRRELIVHGMQPDKIVRIAGMADVDKLEEAKKLC